MPDHIQFITGRLAEHALQRQVAELATQVGFEYTIDVLPITVAALMSPGWIAKHWQVRDEATRVLIPGYCHGDLSQLTAQAGKPVERGPRDLRQLPEFFGQRGPAADYGAYDIQIVAEINNAPRITRDECVRLAKALAADGADLIDVGCDPGENWTEVADCVRALRNEGLRVSIDSLNPLEIAAAVQAGAELVLSVNSTNREFAADWGCEVIAIPDDPATLAGLDETIDYLAKRGVPLRIDPILEPIGCGFAASIGRYLETRRRYPDAEMLMGIGNLTELTDVDSAGVNVLLLGICQELEIRSVLTTQVIPWAQSSIRECDLGRRLVHYAVNHHVPPKRIEPRLVTLRDPTVAEFGPAALAELAAQVRDHNYRIFAEGGELHVIAKSLHLQGRDPFLLFERLLHPGFGGANDTHAPAQNIDPNHAFYLGYELAKAATALTLGKEYRQDEALRWGHLTVEEESHRLRKARPDATGKDEAAEE